MKDMLNIWKEHEEVVKADAYEEAHKRDIEAGKALKDNSMICPECNSNLEIFPRNKGNSVICQDMIHCHYSRFEPFSK